MSTLWDDVCVLVVKMKVKSEREIFFRMSAILRQSFDSAPWKTLGDRCAPPKWLLHLRRVHFPLRERWSTVLFQIFLITYEFLLQKNQKLQISRAARPSSSSPGDSFRLLLHVVCNHQLRTRLKRTWKIEWSDGKEEIADSSSLWKSKIGDGKSWRANNEVITSKCQWSTLIDPFVRPFFPVSWDIRH